MSKMSRDLLESMHRFVIEAVQYGDRAISDKAAAKARSATAARS
jgi:hypothetical protein